MRTNVQRAVGEQSNGFATQRIASLRGRWRLTARLGWCVVTLLSLAFFASDLREQFSEYTLFWFNDSPPPLVIEEGLNNFGLTPEVYAGIGLTLYIVRAVACYLVGAFLFWRKSTERMAMLVAFLLVALPSGDVDPSVLHAMAVDEPLRAATGKVVEMVAFTLILWLFLLFPDGRFTPRWTLAVAVPWLLAGVGTLFLPGSPVDLFTWPVVLSAGFIPAAALLAIWAQIWRYRRISGPVERQQTKWVVLGLTVIFVDFAIGNVLTGYAPLAWPAVSPGRAVLTDLLLHTVHNLAFLAVPLSLAIAVLRHHLWNIDSLISRALLYSSLSVTLLAIYLGGVVLLQGVFRALTGQASNFAVAATTLIIAALFQPLRRRLQATIDRRFSRRTYDAERTLAAFGATLREETDLVSIRTDLLATVDGTMQPSHVSLWLRPGVGLRQ